MGVGEERRWRWVWGRGGGGGDIGQDTSSSCPALVAAALDSRGHLTDPLGLQMAEFPLNPMFAKMLLESGMLLPCQQGRCTLALRERTSRVPLSLREAGLLRGSRYHSSHASDSECVPQSNGQEERSGGWGSTPAVNTHSCAPRPPQEKVKRKFTVYEGDHLTLLNVYRAFERVGGANG